MTHVVQLLRTYPNLRRGRDYAFARGGERSVARGYTKAVERASHLIYVEDQYLWGDHVGSIFTKALEAHPDLHVIAVVPLFPDVEGFNRTAQLVGRRRAMLDMARAAPDRVAVYGIENHAGTPVYVHAKTCVVDDTWATIGSDNFNRRSWTHDSELSAVVVDPAATTRGACGWPSPPSTSTAAPTTWTTASTPRACSRPTRAAPTRSTAGTPGARSGRARRAGSAACCPQSSAG